MAIKSSFKIGHCIAIDYAAASVVECLAVSCGIATDVEENLDNMRRLFPSIYVIKCAYN